MTPRDTARIEAIQYMRFTQNRTLQEIGDHYGISRERVRQILGNTGDIVVRQRTKEKVEFIQNSTHQTNDQLEKNLFSKFGIKFGGRLYKIRSTTRHAISGGAFGQGTEAEDLVSEKLNSMGIRNEQMPHHHPFDIKLANGKTIDVKAAFRPCVTSKAQTNTMYRFGVGKDRRGDYCDFFICYIKPTEDFFIIPNENVNMVQTLYINWPTPERSWAGWEEYHNRWDLLR